MPEAHHGRAKSLPIFGILDRRQGGAEQRHAIPVQDPALGQRQGKIQPGLPSQRGQESIRPLPGDYRGHELRGQRLNVHPLGDLDIGHDRRRVAVDQDDFHALLAQRPAGLRTGVIELGRLPDDDRTGADDEDLLDVGALRHARAP